MHNYYTITIIDCKYNMYVIDTSIIDIEMHIFECLLMTG